MIRILKFFGVSFLFLLLLYILLLTLPYVAHKKVPQEILDRIRSAKYYSELPGAERAAYIDDNTDALLYRLNLIDQAEKEIIFSTFDFNVDEAGKDIMASLLSAAERGVRIRMLVDGFSGMLDVNNSPWFEAMASHENIELKIYNPIHFYAPWKMQARLHDKYLIIDDQMYLLGGRNTFNLFLGDYTPVKNIDRELFIYETVGDPEASIHQLKQYFQSVWELPDAKLYTKMGDWEKSQECIQWLTAHADALKSSYPSAYEPWDYEALTMETNRITLLHNPIHASNKEPWMWETVCHLMGTGKEITVYTPYIICGKEMYADLTALCKKTDLVEIITNDVASGANPWGCTDYLNQKKKIWATGVRVYEYLGEHSSHSKAVLIDDRMSIVGSYNMDMRSTYQDTELMLAVDSPELNAVIRKEAEVNKTYSRYMTPEGTYINGENYVPREMSAGKKLFYGVLRVLIMPFRRFL